MTTARDRGPAPGWQRLERRQKTAGPGARATRMVAAADRSGDRRPSRDGERLPAGGRDRGAVRGRSPAGLAAKTGHQRGGVHRLLGESADQIKTGHHGGGVHRLRGAMAMPPPGRAPSASACEPYRELIAEALARGRNAMAIWQDLVDDHGFPGRYASVRRFVCRLRGDGAAGGARRDRDGAWRGGAGRLRRGADGARSRDRQVPAHAALRADARVQPQVGAAAGLEVVVAQSGPSCTSARFAGSAASRASSSSTI